MQMMNEEISYRPIIEDMTWSYSRIETFDDCPYRFFLKYINKSEEKENFFSDYGSFMHGLIERFYKGELKKDELGTEFLLGFMNNVKGEIPPRVSVSKYISNALEYFGSFKEFDMNIVAVEKRFDFKLDGIPFVGYVDLIGEKDGDYYIIDHKSRDLKPRSKRKNPTAKDKELDTMLRQLYIYSAAFNREYGVFPKALCFNCFRTGTFIEEPFDENAYDEALGWVKKNIEEIMNSSEFYPNIDYFSCRYICGVSGDCEYFQTAKERR